MVKSFEKTLCKAVIGGPKSDAGRELRHAMKHNNPDYVAKHGKHDSSSSKSKHDDHESTGGKSNRGHGESSSSKDKCGRSEHSNGQSSSRDMDHENPEPSDSNLSQCFDDLLDSLEQSKAEARDFARRIQILEHSSEEVNQLRENHRDLQRQIDQLLQECDNGLTNYRELSNNRIDKLTRLVEQNRAWIRGASQYVAENQRRQSVQDERIDKLETQVADMSAELARLHSASQSSSSGSSRAVAHHQSSRAVTSSPSSSASRGLEFPGSGGQIIERGPRELQKSERQLVQRGPRDLAVQNNETQVVERGPREIELRNMEQQIVKVSKELVSLRQTSSSSRKVQVRKAEESIRQLRVKLLGWR